MRALPRSSALPRRSKFPRAVIALLACTLGCTDGDEEAVPTTTGVETTAVDPASPFDGLVALSVDIRTGALYRTDLADGTDTHIPLPQPAGFANCPRRSSDNRSALVFDGSTNDVYEYIEDGDRSVVLPTPVATAAGCATWNEDDTAVFAFDGASETTELLRIDRHVFDGPVEPARLAVEAPRDEVVPTLTIDVLSDGRVVFDRALPSSDGASTGLWAVDITTGTVEPMLVEPNCFITSARMSPDRTRVAALVGCRDTGSTRLVIGTIPTSLAEVETVVEGTVAWVSWTPSGDGLVIAYSESGEQQDLTLWFVRPDGSDLRRLSEAPFRSYVEVLLAHPNTSDAR